MVHILGFSSILMVYHLYRLHYWQHLCKSNPRPQPCWYHPWPYSRTFRYWIHDRNHVGEIEKISEIQFHQYQNIVGSVFLHFIWKEIGDGIWAFHWMYWRHNGNLHWIQFHCLIWILLLFHRSMDRRNPEWQGTWRIHDESTSTGFAKIH